ncbi:hypothetical protein BZA05DRAFT_387023 [Tricharina praecox]|uniref:uncharacterized protein n=1 Tax=Tricharina praecox TaxID=43433 RepID=UPI00221E493C|nr:uncharacterized protein BZA05DRAFT_387023 [Tricharina praecox]KAI5857021.1 hypothetical protein BZA05DRAFT_387023 [Tricharina praecox]
MILLLRLLLLLWRVLLDGTVAVVASYPPSYSGRPNFETYPTCTSPGPGNSLADAAMARNRDRLVNPDRHR